jgi:hypothetical protein
MYLFWRFAKSKRVILRACLENTFFQGIYIFLRKNKLISIEKMKISWEIGVSKLALRDNFTIIFYSLPPPPPPPPPGGGGGAAAGGGTITKKKKKEE